MLRKFFSNNVINPSRRKLPEVTISLTFFTFVPATKKINRGNLKAGLEQFGVYVQHIGILENIKDQSYTRNLNLMFFSVQGLKILLLKHILVLYSGNC